MYKNSLILLSKVLIAVIVAVLSLTFLGEHTTASAQVCGGSVTCCFGEFVVKYEPEDCEKDCTGKGPDCELCVYAGTECTNPHTGPCGWATGGRCDYSCPSGYVSGSCQTTYPPPPPPPPVKYKCVGTQCTQAVDGTYTTTTCGGACTPATPPPPPPPPPPSTCGPDNWECTQDSQCGDPDLYDCNNYCCVDQTAGGATDCGYHNSWGITWMRFRSVEDDGTVKYWKGPGSNDPIRPNNNTNYWSMNDVRDENWSVDPAGGGGLDAQGYFKLFRAYDDWLPSNQNKVFNKAVNPIDSQMDVIVETDVSETFGMNECGGVKVVSGTAADPVNRIPLTPAAPEHWSNHFCGTGRALGPDSSYSNMVPGQHRDEDNKLRYGRVIDASSYTTTRTDYDGCTNFFLQGKKTLPSDKDKGSATGYWEELRNQLIRTAYQSVWPDLRYDGYWSMSFAPWRKWQNAQLRAFVYVKPPQNYACGTAYLGNDELTPEPNDKYPEYCRYTYSPSEISMLLVNFVKNELSFCQADIKGSSEAIINTNTTTTTRTMLPTSASSFSNLTNILTTMRMSPIQSATSFPAPTKFVSTAPDFLSLFTQANYLTRYYYKFNPSCKTTEGNETCIVSSVPTLNLSNYNYSPNLNANTGVYYSFCQMEEVADSGAYVGPICTGSPYCLAEGGSVDCESTNNPSCSEPSSGMLEEIAMSINTPYYRRCKYNDNGVPVDCTSWSPGPFDYGDELKMGETTSGIIEAIGLADYFNPSDGINYTTYVRFHNGMQYYTVIPNEKHGFPKWETLNSKTAVTTFSLPAGERVASYTIKYLPSADKFHEEMWRIKDGLTKHYVRTIGRTGTRPDFFSSTPWTLQAIATTNLTNPAYPVAAHGSYILPKSSGTYSIWESLYQNDPTGNFSARHYRNATWTPESSLWPAQAVFSAWSKAISDSTPNTVFAGSTLPKRMDAYDAHFIPNAGISDKARLVYQCLDNCNACSNGEADGCGGNCNVSPLIGATGVAPVISRIYSGTSNGIPQLAPREDNVVLYMDSAAMLGFDVAWNGNNQIERYEVLAHPIDNSVDQLNYNGKLSEADKAKDLATLIAELGASNVVTQTVNPVLPETITTINLSDAASPLLAQSPTIRVMVRACNVCGCSEWSAKDVLIRSQIQVKYYEVSGTNTCPVPPANPPASWLPLTEFVPGGPNANVDTMASFAAQNKYPSSLPSGGRTMYAEPRNSPVQLISNLWFAPQYWFGTASGLYTVTVPEDDLNDNGFSLACNSGTQTFVDAPSVVNVFLMKAFDAWWRTMGGLVATEDGAIESLIPTTCQDDSACVDILVGANPYVARSTPSQTAGLAIAGGDETLSANAGRYSQNFGDPHAQGDVTIQPPYNYAYFKAKIEKAGLELRGDWNQLRTGGPLSVPAQEYNSVPYYIWHVVPGASDSTLQIDPAKWALGNEKVIILVETSMAFSSTGPATNLITIGSGGYLLVAAQDNLYFENSIGRVMDASIPVNDATPVLSGLFIADNFLTIADSGDPDDIIKDNQFVGKGTFVGYEDVVLERKFDDGSSGRTLNNLQPAELFVHDPQLMLNTPEFLKDPVIQFMEIQ